MIIASIFNPVRVEKKQASDPRVAPGAIQIQALRAFQPSFANSLIDKSKRLIWVRDRSLRGRCFCRLLKLLRPPNWFRRASMFQHALAIAGHRNKKGASAITGMSLTIIPTVFEHNTFKISSYSNQLSEEIFRWD
jgi:hypothetical protein